MKLFQKKSVCKECNVYFKPATGFETRWGDLCSVHRQPVIELALRKDAVMAWASVYWESIEPIYLKKEQEAKEAYAASLKERMSQQQSMQNMNIAQQYADIAQQQALQKMNFGG